MALKSKCKCGRSKSKYSDDCKRCYKEKNDKRIADNMAILKVGKCPTCGGLLKSNLSLTGWYQCEQLGAECFRKDPLKPSCFFQMFVV